MSCRSSFHLRYRPYMQKTLRHRPCLAAWPGRCNCATRGSCTGWPCASAEPGGYRSGRPAAAPSYGSHRSPMAACAAPWRARPMAQATRTAQAGLTGLAAQAGPAMTSGARGTARAPGRGARRGGPGGAGGGGRGGEGEGGGVGGWVQAASWEPATGADADTGLGAAGSASELRAPCNGRVLALPASVGQALAAGETVVVIESMKLEHRLASPDAATLAELLVGPGQQVSPGQVLAR